MRISDWSSDVCSSDLADENRGVPGPVIRHQEGPVVGDQLGEQRHDEEHQEDPEGPPAPEVGPEVAEPAPRQRRYPHAEQAVLAKYGCAGGGGGGASGGRRVRHPPDHRQKGSASCTGKRCTSCLSSGGDVS